MGYMETLTSIRSKAQIMHYYQDHVHPKKIYISGVFLESTELTYLGFYANPDRKMVVAYLFPNEEGYSLEEI